ncbi:hypothetical protein T459_04559 [Capsicum annuum]|uniref:MADS-box domain-containing protein n=1 Tax=Capsicum annuum TaxID=4072 RepID=A0A2G3A5C7_CAPAN|nr:hypothetical protein T459_04559 [Capsicum annuum]
MKLIEPKDARYVTFSKRKVSLFTKANELLILTGADNVFSSFHLGESHIPLAPLI